MAIREKVILKTNLGEETFTDNHNNPKFAKTK